MYTYAHNNPIYFIDPSGHYVSAWDRANLSKSQLDKLALFTTAWDTANKVISVATTPKVFETTGDGITYKRKDDNGDVTLRVVENLNVGNILRMVGSGSTMTVRFETRNFFQGITSYDLILESNSMTIIKELEKSKVAAIEVLYGNYQIMTVEKDSFKSRVTNGGYIRGQVKKNAHTY